MLTYEIRRILEMVVTGAHFDPSDRQIVLDYLLDNAKKQKEINFVTESGIGVPQDLFEDVTTLLIHGMRDTYNANAIEAIKLVRVNLGVGLKEAKDIVQNSHFSNYMQKGLGPLPVTPCDCKICRGITNRMYGGS